LVASDALLNQRDQLLELELAFDEHVGGAEAGGREKKKKINLQQKGKRKKLT